MNPKSLTIEGFVDEMFGYNDDSNPPQWQQGVFAVLMKAMIVEPPDVNRWLLMDGPVDTLWIENMNSLLDDSKLLTLNNGDRMPLANHCKLTFETENLDVASPATISRVGLVYMDVDELGYQPILQRWVKDKGHADIGIKGEDYFDQMKELCT